MRRKSDSLGRLYVVYHEANERHFAGLLPALPIRIEKAARPGKVETQAYLWCDDFTGQPRYIIMDERTALGADWPTVRATLIHEVIHVWQAVQGRKVSHDAAFRAKAKELGISERAVD